MPAALGRRRDMETLDEQPIPELDPEAIGLHPIEAQSARRSQETGGGLREDPGE